MQVVPLVHVAACITTVDNICLSINIILLVGLESESVPYF